MMHGRELEGVRPLRRQEPITTVDLMAGSGLKYVHATNRGRNGMVGDLERCREKVLDTFVQSMCMNWRSYLNWASFIRRISMMIQRAASLCRTTPKKKEVTRRLSSESGSRGK